jgi:hypothetical protein
VQVPAQPVLDPGPLADEVLAVVDEQPQLPARSLELSGGQLGLADRRARDRQRVDRVRLAPAAGRAARAGHQLRRHPHHRLAAADQKALQPTRDLAAVLKRETALATELPGPLEQAGMALLIAPDRQLAEQLAGLAVDRRRCVGLLVWVHPDHDHVHRPFVG